MRPNKATDYRGQFVADPPHTAAVCWVSIQQTAAVFAGRLGPGPAVDTVWRTADQTLECKEMLSYITKSCYYVQIFIWILTFIFLHS